MLQGQEVPGQVFQNRGEILSSPLSTHFDMPDLLEDVTVADPRARSYFTVQPGLCARSL